MHLRHALWLLTAIVLTGCGSVADPTRWLGSYTTEKPAELAAAPNRLPVTTLWSTDTGDGADGQRLGLVARVDGDRVFTADADGRVVAVEAASGRTLWQAETKLDITGGPGVGEGLVLVGTGNAEVAALDAATGAPRWTTRVTSEVLSVPAAAEGKVIIHAIDGRLVGHDAADGKPRWQYDRVASGLGLRASSSPVVAGTRAVSGMAGGKLVMLDIASGAPVWETTVTVPTGRSELARVVDIAGDPLVHQGSIYVATYNADVASVDEGSGQVGWRRKLSSYAPLATDGRAVYASDDSGTVWALDARNGAALWKQDALRARRLSGPAAVGDYVVVGDFEGYVHWLSAQDGSFVARSRVGSAPITAQPQVVGSTVYVLGDKGDLAALRPAAGAAN
jgi:outer membrane protein assembly factor BamB